MMEYMVYMEFVVCYFVECDDETGSHPSVL